MRRHLVRVLERLIPIADVFLWPFVYPAALLLKLVRRGGVHRMRLSKAMLLRAGVFPIRRHYYEPLFHPADTRLSAESRSLPGISWNADAQLAFLDALDYSAEVERELRNWNGEPRFHFDNEAFEPGDAEIWYSIVRRLRPRTIIEIGSGFSTLLAARAIALNRNDDPDYACRHVCIEPYEMPWLERLGVSVLRQKIEDVDSQLFATLGPNDILFIDSSHVIRPRGDVLTLYLEILPRLAPAVIVHVHDIFSPRDYPLDWIRDKVLLWNEQYLLEAFLTHNRDWTILAALNYLHHAHPARLRAKCPFLRPADEPGSFYMQRM